jgi:hypothetical protein
MAFSRAEDLGGKHETRALNVQGSSFTLSNQVLKVKIDSRGETDVKRGKSAAEESTRYRLNKG